VARALALDETRVRALMAIPCICYKFIRRCRVGRESHELRCRVYMYALGAVLQERESELVCIGEGGVGFG